MYTLAAPLGFSLNPLHYAKKGIVAAGHGVARGAHGVESAAKAAGKVALLPVKAVEHIASGVLKLALRPVTSRVHTLTNRRAAKIAFDARKSNTPTPAEHAQAKSWTKAKLKGEGPQGHILALFAGPLPPVPAMPVVGLLGQDPATVSVIAASIPVFVAVMNSALNKFHKSGEAPAKPGDAPAADPAADAAATAAAADGTAAGGDAGADASADDGSGGGGGGGGGKGMIKLPGGMKISKKQAMIGGAVIGGVVLLVLLMPSKKS